MNIIIRKEQENDYKEVELITTLSEKIFGACFYE